LCSSLCSFGVGLGIRVSARVQCCASSLRIDSCNAPLAIGTVFFHAVKCVLSI
jgi:hypothetical protein